MKGIWKQWGEVRKVRKMSRGGRLSAILRAFLGGEIILGVLEMPGAPPPPKWAANHQTTRPETGKKCQKPMKTKHAPLIPTMASRIFLDGKCREYGRNRGTYARLGKPLGESQVSYPCLGFPGDKQNLEVLEMPGALQKQK